MNEEFEIFTAIDTLVLERMTERKFRCLGLPPSWCSEVWPLCARGVEALAPEEPFPFLEVFLNEAERAWATPARVDSETWTYVDEHANEVHLQATALRVGTRELLLIARCDALHSARQLLLQRARELRLAHDAAARAAEQKDVLVHCIIHDLQAPLRTILSSLTQLQDATHSGNLARLAATALQAATVQRELILDILQLFAAEPIAPGTTDLVPIITSAVALFEPVARARGQTLIWDPKPFVSSGIGVVGEPRRLERVVTNLLENAIQNALGAVSIAVQVEGHQVCVFVDDDGPPVPADVAPSLFAKLGNSHDEGGSGLALYFCRITVERWGGSIGHEPGRRGGTRFWLRLPTATTTSATAMVGSSVVAR